MQFVDQNNNDNYQTHLKITDMLDLNEVQTILLKIWFNSLLHFIRANSTFGITAKNMNRSRLQPQQLRPLTPNSQQLLNLTFANCQECSMNTYHYQELLFKIELAIQGFNQQVSYENILLQLKTSQTQSITYETFSLQILQLFGPIIQIINEIQVGTLLRRILIAITHFTPKGKITLRENTQINPIPLLDIIGKEQHQHIPPQQSFMTEELQQQPPNMSEQHSSPTEPIRPFNHSNPSEQYFHRRGRSYQMQKEQATSVQRSKLDVNNSFSQNYSIDEVLKRRNKADLSAFMFQGFEITDYTQSINKLHKQLLKKIILNR